MQYRRTRRIHITVFKCDVVIYMTLDIVKRVLIRRIRLRRARVCVRPPRLKTKTRCFIATAKLPVLCDAKKKVSGLGNLARRFNGITRITLGIYHMRPLRVYNINRPRYPTTNFRNPRMSHDGIYVIDISVGCKGANPFDAITIRRNNILISVRNQ